MLAISEQNWTIGRSRRARIPGSVLCVLRTGWPGSASDGHDNQGPQSDTLDAQRIASKTEPAGLLAVFVVDSNEKNLTIPDHDDYRELARHAASALANTSTKP
jgi:hypothetical protein